MKTSVNLRAGELYRAPAQSETVSVSHSLSEKIETFKETLIELMNELETLKVLAGKIESFRSLDAVVGEGGVNGNLHEMVQRFEIDLICHALAQTGGHQIRAAYILGINVTTLNSMIKRYQINPQDYTVGRLASGAKNADRDDHHGSVKMSEREQTN